MTHNGKREPSGLALALADTTFNPTQGAEVGSGVPPIHPKCMHFGGPVGFIFSRESLFAG